MSDPSIYDRGFQFGDGLFETIRVEYGELQQFDLHWQRLKLGAERLGFRLPSKRIVERRAMSLAKPAAAAAEGEATPTPTVAPLAALKLQVTRGNSAGGYAAAEGGMVNLYFSLRPIGVNPNAWQQGIQLRWCQQRLAIQPSLAGIKHGNRLEQVLARREWQHECQEGLMLDTEGYVVEGTSSNLFAYVNERWVTPTIDRCGVAGTMRQQLLNYLNEHGGCEERRLRVADIETARALLVCNAIIGVWPVRQLAAQRFDIDAALAAMVDHFAPQAVREQQEAACAG